MPAPREWKSSHLSAFQAAPHHWATQAMQAHMQTILSVDPPMPQFPPMLHLLAIPHLLGSLMTVVICGWLLHAPHPRQHRPLSHHVSSRSFRAHASRDFPVPDKQFYPDTVAQRAIGFRDLSCCPISSLQLLGTCSQVLIMTLANILANLTCKIGNHCHHR